jgi:predicted transcriptional regulator
VSSFVNNELIDTEFIILENIYGSRSQKNTLRQRDLAQVAGTSLGMTNSILKRLAQKGWITAKKLNSRNIQYAITPNGVTEVVHRSYSYFKRTIKNIVFYKDILDEVIQKAKRKNINAVLLIGISDLEFILEHSCHQYGLSFLKVVDTGTAMQALDDKTFAVFAENIPENNFSAEKNVLYLSKVLIEKITSL